MKHVTSLSALVIVLVLLMTACGGGGGGGTGTGGVAYTGVTAQAPLTAANANAIFFTMWNGGAPSASISLSPAASKTAALEYSKGAGILPLTKHLAKRLSGDLAGLSGGAKKMRSASPVNETIPGAVSGTLAMTGSMDETTLTGSMTMTFTNFNDGDGYTIDGVVTVRIDGFDRASESLTDATMSFTSWTMKSTGSDFTLGGSIRMQESIQGRSETLTINMNGRDNIGNDSFRFENYVGTTVYDNLLYPTTGSETYSGRVYAGRYGYVDVSTVSPCIYSDPNADPGSGGPIMLAGAGNTKAAITPISTSYVKIEVDNNGDGVYEVTNAYAWSNLDGAPVAAVVVANAGPDQTVSTGSLVTLDGSGSTDLNGGNLTYTWIMTAKPAESISVLSSLEASTTTFIPDAAGTFIISLVVSNGTTSSSPDTVVITATYSYSTLTADAGPYQNVTTGSVVTLDGSGSWDLNGGTLTYAWTMTSRPMGSNAVLSSPSSRTTTFIADVAGSYTIDLVVSNGTKYSSPSTAVVSARVPLNSGLLKPYVAYPTGSHPEAVAIGDVTGDGKNDVVLVTFYNFDPAKDYHLFVFAQDSSGSLATAVSYTTTGTYINPPKTVAIGDMNNDGKNEVVVGNSGNNIEIFARNDTGGLVSNAVYTTVNSNKIKIADLNHDGRLDVAGIGWGTGTVDVFLQNAGGTLDPPVISTVTHDGYDDLEVGDVNNDGLTDIIVMSGQGWVPNIGILIQKADGTFNPAVYYYVGVNELTSGVGVGDVNGDSLQDVVVSCMFGSRMGVFYQNNSGTLNPSITFPSYSSSQPVEIADINTDGRKDVIVAHGGWANLGVYLQGADGTLLSEELYPIPYSPYYPHGLAVGDLNGDGLNDVALADSNNGLVVLYHK